VYFNNGRANFKSNMKVIYLEQTILLLSQRDPDMVQELIQSGQIKQSEDGKPYLVIEQEI
jgi:hypothetical protein